MAGPNNNPSGNPPETHDAPQTSASPPPPAASGEGSSEKTSPTPDDLRIEPVVDSNQQQESSDAIAPSPTMITSEDPFDLKQYKRPELTKTTIKAEHPGANNHRKIHKYYTRQNAMIDQFLQSSDEERLAALDYAKNGPKVKWAVNLSFGVNFCLFVIQLYAAVSTGSLALFATAADAFMDLVSSVVMLTTSRLAARPNPVKYPVGRRRIETVGIILFCALMTTVAIQLIIESARSLAGGETEGDELHIIPLSFVGVAIFSKFCLFCYCFWLRRYPAAHIFFIDHRNDLAVNVFGLVMSVVGDRFVWYLDPTGAICIALLILFSWVSTAFDNVWLLVGKSAPREFVNKCIYVSLTHDSRIQKVDTCRAYHSGEHFYVEVDIIMDPTTQLKDSHDVSQTLQRKLEGLAHVERAFVHVDYDNDHNANEEHKPLYEPKKQKRTLREWVEDVIRGKKKGRRASQDEAEREVMPV